jgi:hypothetical protein
MEGGLNARARAGTAGWVHMGNRAGLARITGLCAVRGLMSRHVGWPGTARLSKRANRAESNRVGPTRARAMQCRTA